MQLLLVSLVQNVWKQKILSEVGLCETLEKVHVIIATNRYNQIKAIGH